LFGKQKTSSKIRKLECFDNRHMSIVYCTICKWIHRRMHGGYKMLDSWSVGFTGGTKCWIHES